MATYLEDVWKKGGDLWNSWFRSGGGSSGDPTEFGGLTDQDKEFKKYLYDMFQKLPQGYEGYEGDRFADRSPEELALLKELKGGGDYKQFYDKASTDLGFTKQAYKDAAGYGVGQLDKDAADLMGAGSTYRNAVRDQVLQDMNRGASMSGMDIRGRGIGAGAAFGDRGDVARSVSNRGYLSAAGDQLSKLNLGAYDRSLNRARQLQQDRLGAAGKYGSTVMQDLGIGTEGLDKRYSTSLGAFGEDRSYKDRDLGFDYKTWQDKKNFPYKKLSLGSNLFSSMPIEEKGMTQYAPSGGK